MKAPLFALIAVLFTAAPFASADESRPNILLIFADDVGREVLGCYGGTSYETPAIDALAGDGMRFEHCYSMPVCHPSRVCIMTGAYPATQGNPGWGDFADDYEDETFAHLLKRAGYATAVAGKWQLALMKNDPDHPGELGFDHWSVFGWHEGARFHDPMIYEPGGVREDTEGEYGPDLYVDSLVDFMKDSRDEGKPFFAYYSMALCHDVTDDLNGEFVSFYEDDRWMNYAEMAESMDEMVGRLTDALDDLGLREDTVVIFTTDNGTAASSYIRVEDGKMVKEEVWSDYDGRRIRGGKGEFTDWGTRVPLIARWPGKIEAGTVADDLVDFADFLPTLADLAGEPVPEGWAEDGVSFAPRLLGEGESPREWAYSELRGKRFVRTRRFKLYGNGRFYDLENDPEEENPVKPAEIGPEAVEAHGMLQDALASVPEPKG